LQNKYEKKIVKHFNKLKSKDLDADSVLVKISKLLDSAMKEVGKKFEK
jgi:hypothetical protein